MTGHHATGQQVVRVEEFLPYPVGNVWYILTTADMVARWLRLKDFNLETGCRLPIGTDPVRQVGMGGTGQFEVLGFEEGEMLRISWRAARKEQRGLDSTVTFTLTAEGTGTRLLIEHDGHHPCGISIGASRLSSRDCRTSTRRVGEVPETTSAWRACMAASGTCSPPLHSRVLRAEKARTYPPLRSLDRMSLQVRGRAKIWLICAAGKMTAWTWRTSRVAGSALLVRSKETKAVLCVPDYARVTLTARLQGPVQGHSSAMTVLVSPSSAVTSCGPAGF